jgi:hypothetical protein
MVYIMPPSIVSASGAAIDVVNGPVALRRGGASPVTPVRFYYIACSLFVAIFLSTRGTL